MRKINCHKFCPICREGIKRVNHGQKLPASAYECKACGIVIKIYARLE